MSFVIKTPSRPPPSQGEEQTLSDVTARTDLNPVPF